MENFYDMTHVSKSVVDKNKRIEQQTADYLKKYNENLKEEMEAKEAKALNEAMSGARYGYASSVARSKNRVNKLSEEIKYTNESSIIGMTEMVAEVVEKGLLLDESEFVKIYPEYKKDIRDIVKGFLKEAEINEDITNKDTLALMEYVSKTLPGVREGVSLTEDDLANYIAYRKPVNIDKSIKNLSGDVASNVALLMEKEQEKNEKIDKDVKRAQAKTAKKAEKKDEVMTAEEIIDGLESGKLTEEDIDAMLQDGEITQDTYDEVVNAYEEAAAGNEQPVAKKDMTTSQEAPAEEEMDPATAQQDQAPMGDPNAQMPADPSMAGGMTASAMAPTGMPRKQIQMLPDGTMNVNIFESLNNEINNYEDFNDLLLEKFDSNKELEKNAINSVADADPHASGWGIFWGWFFGGVIGIILAILCKFGKKGYAKRHQTGDIAYLIKACKEDAECRSLISEMDKAADNKDKNKLKSLRKEFAMRVRIIKAEMKDMRNVGHNFQISGSIKEDFSLVKETPRCGLVESFAVNEANKMLSEGKEYNGDLCLAKAIMYVTITEAMNTMGLMNIDEKKYSEIATAAGGSLLEYGNIVKRKQTVGAALNINNGVGNYDKNFKVIAKDIVDDSAKRGVNIKDPEIQKRLMRGIPNKIERDLEEYNKNKKESVLAESILVNQYVPVLNNRTDSDSLAERIRRKRLNEQQTLND